MLNDLTPVVINLPAKKDIVIHPISDVHYGSPQFNEKAFTDYLAKYGKEDNNFFVIIGDCINNALKSSVSNIYEERYSPREQKEWLTGILTPIKDKILFGTGGNHERRSVKEVDSDPLYDVFSKLNIEDKYRPNAVFAIIRFGHENRNTNGKKARNTYGICATHGAGNGMYIGSSANKSERFGMAIDGIDCLMVGHTHKPLSFPSRKLKIDYRNKQVIYEQFKVVVATSWLDYGGYPIQKMMTPTAFCPTRIILSSTGEKVITVIQE